MNKKERITIKQIRKEMKIPKEIELEIFLDENVKIIFEDLAKSN